MKQPLIPLEEIVNLPLFRGLNQEDVQPIVQAAYEKHLYMGEYFYYQGDAANRIYLLIEGSGKLSHASQDGRQTLIQVIKPYQLFGLVAMTNASVYTETAQAAKESFALYWNSSEMMAYVMKVPQISLNALRIMSDQLQEIQDRFHQATTQRVEQRLAHTLIRLAAQSGVNVDEGVLIDIALTRKDLAEMSGTTLFTASRILSEWDEQKLVIAGREKIVIRSPHGLARIVASQA